MFSIVFVDFAKISKVIIKRNRKHFIFESKHEFNNFHFNLIF